MKDSHSPTAFRTGVRPCLAVSIRTSHPWLSLILGIAWLDTFTLLPEKFLPPIPLPLRNFTIFPAFDGKDFRIGPGPIQGHEHKLMVMSPFEGANPLALAQGQHPFCTPLFCAEAHV